MKQGNTKFNVYDKVETNKSANWNHFVQFFLSPLYIVNAVFPRAMPAQFSIILAQLK